MLNTSRAILSQCTRRTKPTTSLTSPFLRARAMSSSMQPTPLSTVTPKLHPYIGKFIPCDTITMHERLCTFLSMNIVKGDLAAVSQDWSFLIQNILDVNREVNTGSVEDVQAKQDHQLMLLRQGLDIALQTHLFCGFPRTINALSVLHGINHDNTYIYGLVERLHQEEAKYLESNSVDTDAERKQMGNSVYDLIYGSQRVFDKMNTIHPAIAQYMLSHAYGTVLHRVDQCPSRLREMAAAAALTSGTDIAPQLGSHLRGALRVGCSRDELNSIISQVHLVYGEAAQASAQSTMLLVHTPFHRS